MNNNQTLNESISGSLLAYFASKEFLMTVGSAGALASIITFLKGSSASIQKRFRKVAKMLVEMQKQFGSSESGLDMTRVLPKTGKISSKIFKVSDDDRGALGIIPFVNRYVKEIEKDKEYLINDFNNKFQEAETNQAKAEVCYAMLSSFCNKYFNMDIVQSKLDTKKKGNEKDSNKYLIDTFEHIIKSMHNAQSQEGDKTISPFYSRVYKNYMKMVEQYINLCTTIVNNFKKYTKINGDTNDKEKEKQENELAAAVTKFEAELAKQKDGYEANFYRVINTIISSDEYTEVVDMMLKDDGVIPKYKNLIENGASFNDKHEDSSNSTNKDKDKEGDKDKKSAEQSDNPKNNIIDVLKGDDADLYGNSEDFVFVLNNTESASEEPKFKEDQNINEADDAGQTKLILIKDDKAFLAQVNSPKDEVEEILNNKTSYEKASEEKKQEFVDKINPEIFNELTSIDADKIIKPTEDNQQPTGQEDAQNSEENKEQKDQPAGSDNQETTQSDEQGKGFLSKLKEKLKMWIEKANSYLTKFFNEFFGDKAKDKELEVEINDNKITNIKISSDDESNNDEYVFTTSQYSKPGEPVEVSTDEIEDVKKVAEEPSNNNLPIAYSKDSENNITALTPITNVDSLKVQAEKIKLTPIGENEEVIIYLWARTSNDTNDWWIISYFKKTETYYLNGKFKDVTHASNIKIATGENKQLSAGNPSVNKPAAENPSGTADEQPSVNKSATENPSNAADEQPTEVKEENIEHSKNFNPKDDQELNSLLTISSQDYKTIDEFNDAWMEYKENVLKDKNFGPWKLLDDSAHGHLGLIPLTIKGIGIADRSSKLCLLHIDENGKNLGTYSEIKYDYTKSFFDNVMNLFKQKDEIYKRIANATNDSYNIEYSKQFNLAESFMGTLSYLKVTRNITIDSKDNYYVLSENAWGDGSLRNPIEYLKNKLDESSKFHSYTDFANYAKSSVSINFIPVSESSYKTSLPYNRYQMLTESNPLYESLVFVSFDNSDERKVKNIIKVQDIQKIVG